MRLVTTMALSSVFATLLALAQTSLAVEPRDSTHGLHVLIGEGASLFRANCSGCHGLDAEGGSKGPALRVERSAHRSSASSVYRIITHGIDGTEMSASDLQPSEVRAIVAYLLSLEPTRSVLTGDARIGQMLFITEGCSSCHMVRGRGGSLGPDLSRVGASRSIPYLIESIREPTNELSIETPDPNDNYGQPMIYDTVTVVTKSGLRVTGVAKNQDTFSIQLLDTDQHLHLFLLSELAKVSHEPQSLMPAYSESAIDSEHLNDLLAYLESLR